MIGRRMWGAVAIVAVSSAGLPQALQAQSAESEYSVRIERAELLADHALLLVKQQNDYVAAASTMREVALLRGEDQGAVEALVQAGYFSYYAGRPLNAVSALKSAGETALAIGDLEAAADAFWQAAWVAGREGEIPTALELVARSRLAAGASAVGS